MSRKQTLLLGGFYFILCLLVQIILLWGFHKRLDVLWLIGLALIAYQPVRQPRGGDRENDPAPLLPYLFAALPLIINLVIASQFFH